MAKTRTRHSSYLSLLRKIFLLTCAVAALLVIWQKTRPPDWWQYALKEQITQQPVPFRDKIILATNYGTIQAIHQRSGEVSWTIAHEKEVAAQPFIKNNMLYTGYADGTIVAIDPIRGKVIWQFTIPEEKLLFTGISYSESQLYFGDSGGVVHALSLRTGKEEWSRRTPNPAQIDPLVTRDGILWFGTLLYERGQLYVVRTHGYVAKLNPTHGQIIWERNLEQTVHAEALATRESLYLSTTQNSLLSISRVSGESEVLSQEFDSDIYCHALYTPRGVLSELLQKTAQKPVDFLAPFEENSRTQVIQVSTTGMVVGRSPSSGRVLWSADLGFAPNRCFFDREQHLYLSSSSGKLVSIDLSKQKRIWEIQLPAKILALSSIQKPQFISQQNEKKYFYTNFLFASDEHGTLHRINPSKGTVAWSFQTDGTVSVTPVLHASQLYIVSTNGGISRLRASDGKPDLSIHSTKVTATPLRATVDKGRIYELRFSANSDTYHNPYTAVVLTAEFTSPDGKKIPIQGFFYDTDEWRVRFNPSTEGVWTWTARWKDAFGEKTFSGSFMSTRKFEHLSQAKGSTWLTKDHTQISSLVGLNDCLIDQNKDGNPFNDFSIRDGEVKIATTSSDIPETIHFNSVPVDLTTYLDTYRPGFNLFRLSVSNCSPPLYHAENFLHSRFLAHEGRYYDQMSEQLFKRGYHVWFTLFGFSLPFDGAVRYPDEREAIQNYVQYVIARYGAYVDIWEISNEAVASEEYVRVFAKEIEKNDPYHRPITVSWDKPLMPEITLIAPHWYETEPESMSDLATIEQIKLYENAEKPIVFGEQGNRTKNWDLSSAARMRVRVWTAFFHQASLVFWNQTSNKNTYNPTYDNSNIYLGDEERQYSAVFLELTQRLPTDLLPGLDPSPQLPVRSYTLRNANTFLQYTFNSRDSTDVVTFTNPFKTAATLEWFDPTDGKLLRKDELQPNQTVSSPQFRRDIFAKATSSL